MMSTGIVASAGIDRRVVAVAVGVGVVVVVAVVVVFVIGVKVVFVVIVPVAVLVVVPCARGGGSWSSLTSVAPEGRWSGRLSKGELIERQEHVDDERISRDVPRRQGDLVRVPLRGASRLSFSHVGIQGSRGFA